MNRDYFKHEYFWHLSIHRIDLEYAKRQRDDPDYGEKYFTIIEFSRRSERGVYAQAFAHLPKSALNIASVLYVNVSFEESRRKNRRQFNASKSDSILEHSPPEEKLERLYREDDCLSFCSNDPESLFVKETRLPHVIFENEDDFTPGKSEQPGARLEVDFNRLWNLHVERI